MHLSLYTHHCSKLLGTFVVHTTSVESIQEFGIFEGYMNERKNQSVDGFGALTITFKETTVKAKKAARYTIINNKCIVDTSMKFIHTQVLPKLNVDHLKLFLNTPFLHLFCFPKGVQANNVVVHKILTMWDNDKSLFKFHEKELKFTAEEVSLIMCLPNIGKHVNYARTVTKSMLRHRHFPRKKSIRRADFQKGIVKALDDPNCSPEDVVGLLVMYLFTTILFPQAGGAVPLHLFNYVEKLDELKKYNWGEAVFQFLLHHIPSASL